MCRFDILWLILDRANEDNDRKLADHVLAVHQNGSVPAPATEHAPLTPEQLRTYVAMAKQHQPYIPEDLTEYVSAIYAELRRQEATTDRPNSYTTPRTLLSILRLSQGLAKLRFDNTVRLPPPPCRPRSFCVWPQLRLWRPLRLVLCLMGRRACRSSRAM